MCFTSLLIVAVFRVQGSLPTIDFTVLAIFSWIMSMLYAQVTSGFNSNFL